MQAICALLFCISVHGVFTETPFDPGSQNACALQRQTLEILQNHQHLFNDSITISLPTSNSRECWKTDLEILMNASMIAYEVVAQQLSDDDYRNLKHSIYNNLRNIQDSLPPGTTTWEDDCRRATFPLTQFVPTLMSFLKFIPLCLSQS